MLRKVTGPEIREAVEKAGITRIPLRQCSLCSYELNFTIIEGDLFFDPGCYCSRYGPAPLESRAWGEIANNLNEEDVRDESRIEFAKKFGLELIST